MSTISSSFKKLITIKIVIVIVLGVKSPLVCLFSVHNYMVGCILLFALFMQLMFENHCVRVCLHCSLNFYFKGARKTFFLNFLNKVVYLLTARQTLVIQRVERLVLSLTCVSPLPEYWMRIEAHLPNQQKSDRVHPQLLCAACRRDQTGFARL